MLPDIQAFLDDCVERFNRPEFIATDPVGLPRRFSKTQDIEIIGFWVAMLAWGQRKTIIQKGEALIELMDGAPHDFILNHKERDRKRFLSFKHRTFQTTDTLYFLDFFQRFYKSHFSLESAFAQFLKPDESTVENALIGFHNFFFQSENAPERTRKHLSTPLRNSTCKRLNMFLRWMVRQDDKGVDFGIWQKMKPNQLLIPLDVHVDRIARQLGLLKRQQTDWKAVLELSETLRHFDPADPVKYDFALFGLGVLNEKLSPQFTRSE